MVGSFLFAFFFTLLFDVSRRGGMVGRFIDSNDEFIEEGGEAFEVFKIVAGFCFEEGGFGVEGRWFVQLSNLDGAPGEFLGDGFCSG